MNIKIDKITNDQITFVKVYRSCIGNKKKKITSLKDFIVLFTKLCWIIINLIFMLISRIRIT